MKNNIKVLRKRMVLRQKDIAITLSVIRQMVNAIKNNKYNFTLELAMKLVRLLSFTVEELFILEDKKRSLII